MGWYERWTQWTERHRFLVDLATTTLAAILIIAVSAGMSYEDLSDLGGVLLNLSIFIPLPWCRTRPVASCVAVFAVCMVQTTVLGVPLFLPADLVVLVSMYCIAVYGPRWSHLMAWAMAVVGPITVGVSMWIKQDKLFPLQDTAPMIIVIVALLACSFAFGLVRRSRRAMFMAMRDRNERLEIERDQQALIATAAERARIAREMHDIVAHSLSIVIAQADGGRYAASTDLAAAERSLSTIAETGRAALTDMRRLLGVLREGPGSPVPLGLVTPDRDHRRNASGPKSVPPSRLADNGADDFTNGIKAATHEISPSNAAPLHPQPDTDGIGDLIEQARNDDLRVSWTRLGTERRLPPGVSLTLFRVCQEALTNVRKHAGPSPVTTVMLRWGEEEVELRVDDDGRGLAAAGTSHSDEQVSPPGYGLLGMRERAEMFGGTLTAGPRRSGGFSIKFVVPIPRAPEEPVGDPPTAHSASEAPQRDIEGH